MDADTQQDGPAAVGDDCPMVAWNAPAADHAIVIWWAQLDERYLVEVRRSLRDEHVGRLVMFDHCRGDVLVHDDAVLLRLGASYGPSVEDLEDWQGRAESWADLRPAAGAVR